MRLAILGSLALVLFIPLVAQAQLSNASITGVARDHTGAVIPGVSVTAINEDTAAQRTTETNNEGRYLLSDLLPGRYKVSASFAGFKRLDREGISLRVGDRVALDLTLEVGTQTERITVVGEVPLLRTEDAETGLSTAAAYRNCLPDEILSL